MLLITLRDLQWRKRRFIIAVAATSLLLGMTLTLSGLSATFGNEVDRTLGAIGADHWIVGQGAAGPFTSLSTIPNALAADLARLSGIRQADPLIYAHQVAHLPRTADVNLFGYRPGGLGAPPLTEGRPVDGAGEAVVDGRLKKKLGERFEMAGGTFTVVGLTKGLTLLGGIPDIYIGIEDAQAVAFQGLQVVTAVVIKGTPQALPEEVTMMSDADLKKDVMRPLNNARRSIGFVGALLWLVAIITIASVIYLSALERVRDFAVYKATGTSSASLLLGIGLQSVIVAVVAAGLGIGVAFLVGPRFPLPVDIPVRAVLMLPVLAAAVGLLASLLGARRAITVEPALAFGGP